MPIFKRCTRCGRRLAEGSACTCTDRRYAEEDKYTSGSREKKFYKSSDWQIKRNAIVKRYGGIDIYSYFVFNRIESGQTVHHIIPLKDDWSLRFSSNNLMFITEQNHQLIHTAMKKSRADYENTVKLLQGLLVKADKMFGGGGM